MLRSMSFSARHAPSRRENTDGGLAVYPFVSSALSAPSAISAVSPCPAI